ncbi:MAG: hypothetical protein F2799_07710 [Actinobacteria bacterium]|uniref:Unannotated protein n=1 Tax=freshwater metagenome TaxID=449393 RepID=A0A6J7EPP4_9ZZZZ|nr:hypothetical protein [Actinomycetota bacterium]
MSAAAAEPGRHSVNGPWLIRGLLLTCAALAAVSLIPLGQETGNDANSWLVWANQLGHGHGINFSVGPSWKPVPVLPLALVSALSGSVAAYAWLWLVRFCALATSVILFDLIRRDWGNVGGAVAALLPLAISPWVTTAISGMSEPVLVAAAAAAALADRDNRPRLALALGVLVGLIRPEAWLLVLIWLGWRLHKGENRRAIILQGAGATALWLTAWFALPALLGGGALQASNRSGELLANGASLSGMFGQWLRVLPPVAWILIPAGIAAVGLRRKTQGGMVGIALLTAAAIWLIEITLLKALGIEQAISRYALPAGIALCALGGISASCLLLSTATTAGASSSWLRPLAISLVALLTVASLVSGWGPSRDSWNNAIVFQNSSNRELSALNKAGGIKTLGGCLPFATSGYPSHARILARRVGVPLQAIGATAPPVGKAITLTSTNPAVGYQPPSPEGVPAPLAQVGDWTVTYYGPPSGC